MSVASRAENPRVAVVGTNIGSTLHVRALQAAGFEVTALIGRDAERTAQRAVHFGIPNASTSVDEILGGDIDAIIVATPPATHHPIVMAAIAAGKHVLCEKPLATSAALAAEMHDAAREAGVVHLVQHQQRWQPTNAMLRRLVQEQALGTLIQGVFEFDVPMMHHEAVDVPEWWLSPETGGGWLRNWNSHGIDLVRYMVGEFGAVSGRLHSDPARGMTSDDSYVMGFVLEGGVQGAMVGSCRAWYPHVQSRLIGSRGTAILEPNRERSSDALILCDTDGTRSIDPPEDLIAELNGDADVASAPATGLPAMGPGIYQAVHANDRSFMQQVRLCTAFRKRIADPGYQNPALADFGDGLAGLRVIEAVEAAARTQRWVDVEAIAI
jgi:predicted dehydrogenase